ncbi:MAG: 3-isopropylmalate dehydratase small subunit [Spirochaetes bacterium]|nr:3-isopropylmalate dehydratase small subunit [Spirochaetota bacterium]MBU0954322.1 3-isopropylmalate dehydratase small subunit [Spirochaetota bacterium]
MSTTNHNKQNTGSTGSSKPGRVFKYGRDIDTDVIIPARYLNTSDPAELAVHCMEDADAAFATAVKQGDFIVALENFGCGSSREHAPLAIKTSGVACVIASSFARIFYRNAINIGLPILECPEAAEATMSGDNLQVDLATGTIYNLDQKQSYSAQAFPDFMKQLVAAGGLIEYTRNKMTQKAEAVQ